MGYYSDYCIYLCTKHNYTIAQLLNKIRHADSIIKNIVHQRTMCDFENSLGFDNLQCQKNNKINSSHDELNEVADFENLLKWDPLRSVEEPNSNELDETNNEQDETDENHNKTNETYEPNKYEEIIQQYSENMYILSTDIKYGTFVHLEYLVELIEEVFGDNIDIIYGVYYNGDGFSLLDPNNTEGRDIWINNTIKL